MLFGQPFLALAQSKPQILVAAAADLAPLEADLSKGFEGATVRFVFASSGTLARQIQNGAPFDVYLSANEQFVKELAASGHLLPDSVQVYALGRLGLWSKSGRIRSLSDLLAAGILHVAIANPAHAPYGLAAKQVLENQGLWPGLSKKLVYGENVRQTLQFAESGNADAAITAWSLVFGRNGILLPAEWHSPIRQSGGIVRNSKNRETARRFLAFLTGPRGRDLLEKHGLSPISTKQARAAPFRSG
jgi:molybdate transport system substrate-binding protein